MGAAEAYGQEGVGAAEVYGEASGWLRLTGEDGGRLTYPIRSHWPPCQWMARRAMNVRNGSIVDIQRTFVELRSTPQHGG